MELSIDYWSQSLDYLYLRERKIWVARLLMADVWKMDALLAAGVKRGWRLPGIASYATDKLEEMLDEYVYTGYRPDTSKLKQYLQAISADERFELLKKKYVFGDTVLHEAAVRGDTKVMRCLLELVEAQKRYELLKIQSFCGKTPLHVATRSGRTEVMRCMLELVEPESQIQLLDIPDEHNKTALDVAEGEETVQLIKQYKESAERETADKMSLRDYLSCVCNDLSLEERQSLMSDERLRSKSFLVNWPHDGNLSGVKMAQAVFYCVDDYDGVQCAFCCGSLYRWKAEENPITEHAKLFPFCRFVKGLECGNKEYKNDIPEMKKNRDGSVSINSSAFGISTNKAAAIKYAPYETRKNTYGRWPAANVIRPEPLGEAVYVNLVVDGLQPGRMDTADSGPPPASCKTCYKKTSQVVQTDSPSIPPGSIINTYKAGLHGHLQTTNLVADNLKWIFNPSLHGISSAVPSPPSYLTDVLCYVVGYDGNATAVPDQLPMPLQQELAAMSPQQYRAAVRNDLSPIQLYWLMSIEMQRRRTFLDDWPHSGNLSGEQMAQFGLYHSGGYDSVRCYFCGVVLEKWEVGDDPMTEHKRWSTGCMFMAGWDCTIMGQQPSEDALPQEETAR